MSGTGDDQAAAEMAASLGVQFHGSRFTDYTEEMLSDALAGTGLTLTEA